MARPQKEINWDLVEKKMESGNSARTIADSLHIEINTFYDRFKQEFGKSFADYADKFHQCGKANIQFTQYMKALSGNIPMLLLLGKEWLGQGQEAKPVYTNEDINAIRHELMLTKAELAAYKESNANKS